VHGSVTGRTKSKDARGGYKHSTSTIFQRNSVQRDQARRALVSVKPEGACTVWQENVMKAHMNTRRACLAVMLISLVGASQAAFIPVPPPTTSFEFVNTGPGGSTSANVTYDAITHVFTATAPFGSLARPASLLFPFPLLLPHNQDIVGTFDLLATIANDGTVLDGTFMISATSPVLGIFVPVMLLSGTIVDGGRSGGILQLSGPMAIAANLEAVVGPTEFAVLNFIGVPDFNASFIAITASQSPDIFGIRLQTVPEPSTLVLTIVALGALGSRRRSALVKDV